MGTLDKKLEISNISKVIQKKIILEDINFDVYNGEFLSILGPSGCGKSTLLRILVGLTSPSTGKITKGLIDITNKKPSERGMGIVFQNYALFENMTVRENIEYALRCDKNFKTKAREITLNLAEQVGLNEHINKKPRQLSGGQQQRVAIARTLALNPDIILFDEPMSALDITTRTNLRNELKKIQKQFCTTMIYVTHDQEEAFTLSDRIMVMDQAIIHQIDTPQKIFYSPANKYVEKFVVNSLKAKISALSEFME